MAGQGVHQWLYGAAHKTYKFLEQAEQVTLIKWAVSQCGRPLDPAEVEKTVRKVRKRRDRGDCADEPPWPKPEPERVDQLVMAGPTLAQLCELSPIQPLSDDPAYWLNVLFPGDPLLCITRERMYRQAYQLPEIKRYWVTKTKSQWVRKNLRR